MEIQADDVEVSIGRQTIIRGASLTCRPGTMTALVGPSGCGKTTLLHCMGLLQRPTAGRIRIDGVDATDWSSSRRRRFWSDSCAFVLQDYGLMDEESVAFNVTMSASIVGRKVVGDQKRLRAALAQTGLSGREREAVIHLSGGEKRRLGVARALYKDARVVLVDEPTASLDGPNRKRLIEIFELLRREGRTIVVATHDDDFMYDADVVYAVGRPGGIVSDPADLTGRACGVGEGESRG
jgi:putative ABC transport system ATP-binding protein